MASLKPAFPVPKETVDLHPDWHGMTMRDLFAAYAITGILGPNFDWLSSGDDGSRVLSAAYYAYNIADAMMIARANSPAEKMEKADG